MKLNTPYKTVLFYGHVLRVGKDKKYIAADKDGSLWAHRNKPALGQRCWYSRDCSASQTSVTVTFESSEHWENTLTYCGDEHGQEWMLDLKTKIAVEYALLEAGAIPQQKALSNVIDSFPLGESFLNQHWDAFQKHSGVENVASKEFLDVLTEKVKSPPKLFLGVEKPAYLEDNCLLVRVYYGGELVIPAWTKFIGMDSTGRVWVYEEQPEVDLNSKSVGVWTTWGRGRACDVGWRSENTAEKEWRYSLREVQK